MSPSEIIASLEYGALVLGAKVLLVMGHANCWRRQSYDPGRRGSRTDQRASIPTFKPAVDRAGDNLEAATKAKRKNSGDTVDRIVHGDSRDWIKEGKLKAAAALL